MVTERVKLVGKLPNEKPVSLAVLDITVETPQKCKDIVDEYSTVFPNIEITASKGFFKKQIPQATKIALSNLMCSLTTPFNTLISSLN